MDIEVKPDITEPMKKFAYWMNKRQRKNVMKSVRRAGAAALHKRIKKTDAFNNRTGQLRGSFIVKSTREGYVYWIADSPHAYNVEHGHGGLKGNVGAPPHPYIMPVVDNHSNEAITAALKKFEERIAKIFGS